MGTPTYIPLGTITLASTASNVTFSSIPTTGYRDLLLITAIRTNRAATTDICFLRANSDSGNNYPRVGMYGTGSSTGSFTGTESGYYLQVNGNTASSGVFGINHIQIMDYSATDKHKTALVRQTEGNNGAVLAEAGRWANTAAITTLTFQKVNGDFIAGSTFHLFAIAG